MAGWRKFLRSHHAISAQLGCHSRPERELRSHEIVKLLGGPDPLNDGSERCDDQPPGMELTCDITIAGAYKSLPQRARVVSEYWFSRNCYCLACESDRLVSSPPNTRAMDFSCDTCGHTYELKTFLNRPPRTLVDGAYATLLARINSSSAPTLCLLGRSPSWQIESLTAIHSSFLTPWIIEKRRPLASSARRAGWIGCNIRLDRIPVDGEIAIICGGICTPKDEVRRSFKRFLPLAQLSAIERGWTTLTISVIRALGKPRFLLSDLYEREKRFADVYPVNRHIQAKIRQQLQVLRDLGLIAFEGHGVCMLLS
jgi:type II restriction enzyme